MDIDRRRRKGVAVKQTDPCMEDKRDDRRREKEGFGNRTGL